MLSELDSFDRSSHGGECPISVEVLGIEVVQSIQSLDHDVPLLAGKRTAIRVYLRPWHLSGNVPVAGVLAVTRDHRQKFLSGSTLVELRGNGAHPELEEQRRDLSLSLYFMMDASDALPGEVAFSLAELRPAVHRDQRRGVQVVAHPPRAVEFEHGPQLIVRLIAYRVRDPRRDESYHPSAADRFAARSFLTRAFPVAGLVWSESILDAPAGFAPPFSDGAASFQHPGALWQRKFDLLCAQLLAIRARDVDAGQNPATRYYGMVHHPNDFFVGAVSDVPATPRPDIVGIGPADGQDGSYTGHEIAHMLGRLHPGIGGEQSHEDRAFPAEYEGRLSSERERHHGFDVGDALRTPSVLPFDRWFDLMTYEQQLWVSAYTYLGLLQSLRDEEQQPLPRIHKRPFLHVIGIYRLAGQHSSGTIAHVFPGRVRSSWGIETRERVAVHGRGSDGQRLFIATVELKRSAAQDLPRDSGAFHITVDHHPDLERLELWVEGVLVSTWPAAVHPPQRGVAAPSLGVRGSHLDDGLLVLRIDWHEDTPSDQRASVQIRRAGSGEAWSTIAVGLSAEDVELALDPGEPRAPAEMEVRVVAGHGFGETELYRGVPPMAGHLPRSAEFAR